MTAHEQTACSLFRQGYNCAQAVVGAFCDEIGMTQSAALRLASAFGGGMGRMREVCGAVSGMYMVLGILYGYDDATEQLCQKKSCIRTCRAWQRNLRLNIKRLCAASFWALTVRKSPNPRRAMPSFTRLAHVLHLSEARLAYLKSLLMNIRTDKKLGAQCSCAPNFKNERL